MIDANVPAAVLNAVMPYEIEIEEVASGGLMLTSDFKKWKKQACKEFKKEDYPIGSSVDMLISLPHKKAAEIRWRAIAEIVGACDRRGVEYIVLYNKHCNWQNLSYLLKDVANIRYWYNLGHGASHVDVNPNDQDPGVQRTSIQIWKEKAWAPDKKVHLFSYLELDPSDPNQYLPLPGDAEKDGFSLLDLNLGWTGKFKVVHIDSCESGKYDDFVRAIGIKSPYGQPQKAYMGWRAKVTAYGGIGDALVTESNDAVADIWSHFGNGRNLNESIARASTLPNAQHFFWGEDGEPDPLDDPNPDDNFILWNPMGTATQLWFE